MSFLQSTCPSCGTGLKLAPSCRPGQRVRCPNCTTVFVYDDPPPPAPKASVARPEPPREAPDDRPPRPRDDPPRRKRKAARQRSAAPVVIGVVVAVLAAVAVILAVAIPKKSQPGAAPADPAAAAGQPKHTLTFEGRMRGERGMRAVMGSMMTCVQRNRRLPPAAWVDKDHKPLLSWRVTMLIYLGHEDLFRRFRLDEPWDSPTNKALIPLMPAVYQGTLPQLDGKTGFQAFVGGGAAIDPLRGKHYNDLEDGPNMIIGVVETLPAVEWTRPVDLPFDGKTLPPLVSPTGNEAILAGFMDGGYQWVSMTLNPPKRLVEYITIKGGERSELLD